MFPGQGAQYQGMGKDLAEEVREKRIERMREGRKHRKAR